MPPLLEASALHFSYGDTSVLRGVDLTFASGQLVALLGPNGVGKSTLIKVLLGHLPADGSIAWDGKPLAGWSRRHLARLVAYLPQAPGFEPGQRVEEVLRLGRAPYWGAFGLETEHDAAAARDVAAMLDLRDLLNRRMDEISGGQRQRVFLGRCLAQEPRALLLDEPNTFLDLKHQVDLCRVLKRLAAERSIGVLMASHDLNLAAAYADRLVLMDGGRVAAEGPPANVLEPELLSRVFGVRLRRIDSPGGAPVVVADSSGT
jgi:iron complex transport system ATP-binding protein